MFIFNFEAQSQKRAIFRFFLLFTFTISLFVSTPVEPVYAQAAEICGNGLDDDGDGLFDHADPDCPSAPFVCGGEAYLFQRNPTDVYTLDLATGGSVLRSEFTNLTTNAIGYNMVDNYIWGSSQNSAGTQTFVTAIGADFVPINYVVPGHTHSGIGDVSPDGRLFSLNVATNKIEIVNVNVNSPDFLSLEEIPMTGDTARRGADWAFNPIDGNIYMIVTNDRRLLRINPNTGVFTDLGVIGGFNISGMGFGAQFFDGNGTLYGSNNNDGRIIRITEPHNGNLTAEWFADGPLSNLNDGARCTGSSIGQDYGDLPDSYHTLLASNGARHTVDLATNPIYLGATVTIETNANAPLDGTGDGGDNGIADFDPVFSAGSSYSVDVIVNNATGREGTLYGWIDFNLNGTFEAGERASVSVPDGTNSGTVTLNWPEINVSSASTTTYGRFRITTDTTTTSFIEPASDGEVEDYVISPVIVNQIGAAKTISSGPTNNGDGTYTLDYTILVENTGDQDLSNIQVVEDLSTTFAGATGFSLDSVTSGTFAMNGSYDGSTNTNLLAGTDSLAAGASGTITLTITVTPGSNLGPYNNTATTSGQSPEGTTVTDDSQDGTDVDPDGDGIPTNNDEPTPLTFTENPEIGAAKTISSGPTNNGDGTYSLTYTILVENTGDMDLSSVQVAEDLSATFAGASAVSIDSVTSGTYAVNGSYDGSTDTNLLAGTDSLAVGASGTITLTVTVTPGGNLGPYNNTATASGESPSGTTVTDDSQDGTDVDPDGDGTPANNNEPTPLTFTENPEIGAAKTISSGPTNNGDGTHSLTYTILVENTGDMALSSVQVVEDLGATFAGTTAVSIDSVTSGTFAVNGSYDGSTDTNLLAGTDNLLAGASGTITLTVTVTPGSNLGPYNNTATASGQSPSGTTVTDDSQDGTDVDPDGDGIPANNDEPTPVTFIEDAEIGVAKTISSGPTNNGDGTYTLTYTILVENTGDVALGSVQVVEDLNTTFAGVTGFSVDSVNSGTFAINGSYDGGTDTNLLAGTDSLAAGASGTITLTITVTPGGNLGPYNNTATASGTSPSGTTVTDDSQDGTDVDPDGDGTPANNDEATPVTFIENPEIGAAKTISSGPTDNKDGTYTLTYTILVENTGDVSLNSVQVAEDLIATFAGATAISVDSVTSGTFAVNASYDGSTDTNLLAGTDSLSADASGTITLTITVTPGGNLGPYNNTATASGTGPTGTTVTDDSQDGTDVDPDGDGTPSNNNEATPVTFIENPEIGAAKTISSGPTNNGDGTHSLTYTILVENTGDVSLNSVQVAEDLSATFAGATAISVDSVTSGTFAVNGSYDGSTDTNLLAGTDSLSAGASGTITLTITVTPGSNLGPYNNTATAGGTSPAGTTVTDDSQDGTDVDPDGDGTPSNNDEATPVTFIIFSISGKVWDDSGSNLNGVIDTGEPGINDVTVVLVSDPYGTPTCISMKTDANGDYEFPNLNAGVYQVIETAGESVPTPGTCIPNGDDPTGFTSYTNNVKEITLTNSSAEQNFGDFQAVKGDCLTVALAHVRNKTHYELIDASTGVITSKADLPENINVAGYNTIDNLMYAITQDSNQLAIVDKASNYLPLGEAVGLPDQIYVAGDVDDNGHYAILAEGPIHTNLYVVDVDPNSSTYKQLVHTYPLSSSLTRVGDIAFNPLDSNFYGYEYYEGSGQYELIRISQTGFVTRLGILLDIEGNPITGGDEFGAVFFTSTDGRFYGYKNNPGLYMVSVANVAELENPANDPVALELGDVPVATENDGFRCHTQPSIPLYDFGDAPDSYGTLDADGGPKHDIQNFDKIRMGANIHQENDGIPGVGANGDSADGTEEDSVSSFSTLKTTSTNYSVDVTVTNTTGVAAQLIGWIDFNRDGVFTANEAASVSVANGTSNSVATLSWTGLKNVKAGDSYLRLRLTTDGAINTGTPGGLASDGEVEDYEIKIRKTGAGSDGWPNTGFAPGITTSLPAQPVDKEYQDLGGLVLEIPELDLHAPIVSVFYQDEEWDVSWLWNKVGYLEGSAFPTLEGNTVITGHNYLPNGQPGPFLNLDKLSYGDHIEIHGWGNRYIYEIRKRDIVGPDNTKLFNSSEFDIVTLVTCKEFNEDTNSYLHRVVVQAVLIDVESE